MKTSRYTKIALGCAAVTVIAVWASVSGITGSKRPASEQIPAAAKVVTITEDLGLDPGRKPPAPVTITAPAQVSELVAAINGLALFPPGNYSCPAAFGDGLNLEFRTAPGKAPLAVAEDQVSGCPDVALTIDGKQQPLLDGLSAGTILKIANLPWTLPNGPMPSGGSSEAVPAA